MQRKITPELSVEDREDPRHIRIPSVTGDMYRRQGPYVVNGGITKTFGLRPFTGTETFFATVKDSR